jgi:predicted lipoprotein with Yx(FWY)xxD motif
VVDGAPGMRMTRPGARATVATRATVAARATVATRALGVAVLLVAVATLAACGASGRAATPIVEGDGGATATPTIHAVELAQVHTRVLVNGRGFALYVYAPDRHRAVTCAGACAAAWPPVFVPAGRHARLGPGVRPALVGTDRDPVRGTVVTYDHWPLYTYEGDPQPGYAVGQGIDVDGGYWYLLRPDGRPLIPAQ